MLVSTELSVAGTPPSLILVLIRNFRFAFRLRTNIFQFASGRDLFAPISIPKPRACTFPTPREAQSIGSVPKNALLESDGMRSSTNDKSPTRSPKSITPGMSACARGCLGAASRSEQGPEGHDYFSDACARLKSPHKRGPVRGGPEKPCPCYKAGFASVLT